MAPSRPREADGATYGSTPTTTDTLTAAPARGTAHEIGGELRVELAGVCWLVRFRLTRVLGALSLEHAKRSSDVAELADERLSPAPGARSAIALAAARAGEADATPCRWG